MSMELISREDALDCVRWGYNLPDCYEKINSMPTVKAIPKDHIAKAINKVEEYICDHETDTVKAQGMAQALDMFEQELGGLEDGNQQGFKDAKAELEQIRAEIESKLQGVNTTLDVLVKDDALIPTMKTAKTTLEDVLEIIDKAIKEQDE